MNQLQLSAWAYHCLLKLALAISDLAASECILPSQLAEVLQYPPKEMMGQICPN